MKRLAIASQTPTSNQSFEQTYQQAYSHGLENIYALESVDLKTVKPMLVSKQTDPVVGGNFFCSREESEIKFDFFGGGDFEKFFQKGRIATQKLSNRELDKTSGHHFCNFIKEVYLAPWIRDRQGVVNRNDLIERVEMLIVGPKSALECLKFFEDLAFDGKDLFESLFYSVEPNLFVVEKQVMGWYEEIIRVARSYYYKPQLIYDARMLVSWIEREQARKWVGYPSKFIERIFQLSPQFSIRRLDGNCNYIFLN